MDTRRRKTLTDWKRNNKIAIRNFNEAVDFHDIVKLLLVKLLRRKHPDSARVPIYTEHDPDNPNERYPDILMKIEEKVKTSKGKILKEWKTYVWEIQEKTTTQWIQKITKQYEEEDLRIVELQLLPKNSLRVLRHTLNEEFVI